MSSTVQVDNNDTTMTAENKYLIDYTMARKKFWLSLHYNGVNRYLFVNGAEIIKFKAKDPDINAIPLCPGNISKEFFEDNFKKTGFYEYACDFSVDYDAIAIDDILDTKIHWKNMV